MLREVKLTELLNVDPKNVWLLDGLELVPLTDRIYDRILIDEVPQQQQQNRQTGKQKKKRRKSEDLEALIIKTYNSGEHTIKEIMDITGCTYATVRKYIPLTSEG